MKRYNLPLSETVTELRHNQTNIENHYINLDSRVESIETEIHSFVKKPDFEHVQTRINALIEQWKHENIRPPLYGASVGVKDIFQVNGFETRAGTTLPPKVFKNSESPVVTALRNAGAIIMGKTVSTEFAYSPTGPTRNPHNLKHTPGASSSGSAAAVAAGLVSVALGTQTVGSIIRPAAYCGIIGFKPSSDRLSTEGVVPFSSSADQVGFFTQDIDGMELVSSVLCSNWGSSPTLRTPPKVGVPSGSYLNQASETGLKSFRSQLEILRNSGIAVQELSLFESIESINKLHNIMVEAEASLAHAEWYTEYGERYSEVTADMVKTGWQTSIKKVGEGRKSQQRVRNRIAEVMKSNNIDVLVSPAAPGPAPKGIEESGSPIMNLPWTHAKVPVLTVPIEKTEGGLPLGLQCAIQYGYDEKLLSVANELIKPFEK